jgi:hypothetical protein
MKPRSEEVAPVMSRLPVVCDLERLGPGHRHALPDSQRAELARLDGEIRAVSQSPVVTAVLEVADAILLVLNAERQIVAFNSRVRQVETPDSLLGLRPGEALGCVNAIPRGCGTAPACETCGTLGAILGCHERSRPVEAECLVRGAVGSALEFNVRATPVAVDGTRFTVVSLRDISGEKRREVLEQVFFHDVLNTLGGLRGWAQRLQLPGADVARVTDRVAFLSRQIEREIQDHRTLLFAERGHLVPRRERLLASALLADAAVVFSGHPAARDRTIEVAPALDEIELESDAALLLRVLVNMARNALEATPAGGVVRLWSEREPGAVRLAVHNAGVIAPDVQARIFQRSFSTKAERGRGLGTYSMKLFGERYLAGEVSFVSTEPGGTVFSIRLPATPESIARPA